MPSSTINGDENEIRIGGLDETNTNKKRKRQKTLKNSREKAKSLKLEAIEWVIYNPDFPTVLQVFVTFRVRPHPHREAVVHPLLKVVWVVHMAIAPRARPL